MVNNNAASGNVSAIGAQELAALGDAEVKELQRTLNHLIDLMTSRIEYAETRRAVLAAVAGAILAGSAALLTVLPNIAEKPIFWGLLTASIGSAISALLAMLIYARQTNFQYPFTDVSQTWKWFYRYALENKDAFTVNAFGLQNKQTRKQSQQAFNSQWEAFKSKQIPGLSSVRDSTFQDLQQVYLLHINERYKNLFLTQLRNTVAWGMLITGVVAAVICIIVWLFVK